MATKNDNTILRLKEEVKKQKEVIKKIKPFVPVTNCSLDLYGTRYNLHTLNKETIITLLVRLNSYKMSAEELGLEEEFKISGYSTNDWITDLKAKHLLIGKKEEEEKLNKLETKLHNLLSQDKKIELEIDDISKEIYGE